MLNPAHGPINKSMSQRPLSKAPAGSNRGPLGVPDIKRVDR